MARAMYYGELEDNVLWGVGVQIAEAVGEAERSSRKALSAPVISLLDLMPPDVWARLNRLMATNLPKQSQVSCQFLTVTPPPPPAPNMHPCVNLQNSEQ
jgi:hypothetical protein